MAKSTKRGRPSKNQEVENQEENLQEETTEQEPVEEQIEGDVNDNETPEDIAEPEIEAQEPPSPPPTDDSEVIGEGTYGDYNPFSESVVERDYSTPQIATGEVEEIEEPQFVPPTYEDVKREREGGDEEMGEEGADDSGSPFDNPNPALNDLDTKDKKVACESLVDTCLDAYEQLHSYAQYIVKVDDETLQQKHRDGTLDLNDTIPLPDGKNVSVGEFFQQFNEQGTQALSYDREFGVKVKPALLRVFMKRGWGMSDEQYLMYMFSRDIAVKIGIMWQLKKTLNSTIESLEEVHLAKKKAKRDEEIKARQEEEEEEDYDDYEEDYNEVEEEPIMEDVEEVNIVPKKPRNKEGFTKSMEIDMPNKPNPNATQHPTEIQEELNKEKNKKK